MGSGLGRFASSAQGSHDDAEICIEESSMETTLDIDDRLLAQAKSAAAHERSSLTRVIEEGPALRLRKRPQQSRRSKTTLPIRRGSGGLARGIDPCRNQSLYDAADS